MKGIHCKSPFEGLVLYRSGFVNDGRRNVSLYNPRTKKQKLMTLARYRLSVKLGRKLKSWEDADHKDGNKRNDATGNLQVLTRRQNVVKSNRQLGIKLTYIKLRCPICRLKFERTASQVNFKIKQGGKPCCSRSCGVSYGLQQRA